MYLPKKFEEIDKDAIHELIRAQPLATLVVVGKDGITANHIPFLLRESEKSFGKLQAHMPRANPLLKELTGPLDALAIFHGPDGYISPSWYPTKQETGKVVPTWNYAVVHAHGQLKLIDDPDWVRVQIDALTEQNESSFPKPWKVDDAPPAFTDSMIRGLVGLELKVSRLVGKTKASQNQPAVNQAGVIEGLESLGDSNAMALAGLTRKHQESE